MDPDWLNEQLAAEELLYQFGEEAGQRGQPISFLLRPDESGWFEHREVERDSGLLGYVVDDSWSAVATIGTGRFRSLDPASELPARLVPGLAGGLGLACVLSRAGAIGWVLELPDGSRWDEAPKEGFVLDVLRRSLQLPTPPPASPVGELHMIGWLMVALGKALERRSRLGWAEMVEIHRTGCGYPEGEWDDFEFLTALKAGPCWDELRLNATAPIWKLVPGSDSLPEPDLAEWMDSGMFSRWVLSKVPPLEELMHELRTRLHSSAYRRICRILHQLDGMEAVA